MCSLVSSSRSGTGKWVLLKIFLLCAWDMAICMRSCSKKLKMTSFFFPAMTTQVMVALYKNKPFDSSWILICANIYIYTYIYNFTNTIWKIPALKLITSTDILCSFFILGSKSMVWSRLPNNLFGLNYTAKSIGQKLC